MNRALTHLASVAVGLSLAMPLGAEPVATLSWQTEGGEMTAKVSRPEGMTEGALDIDCVAHCRATLHFRELVGEPVLGLRLVNDQGMLLASWWTSGCCYVLRVHGIGSTGVAKVFEVGSRTPPEFATSPSGSIMVTTTEAIWVDGVRRLQTLRYQWAEGRFVPSDADTK